MKIKNANPPFDEEMEKPSVWWFILIPAFVVLVIVVVVIFTTALPALIFEALDM